MHSSMIVKRQNVYVHIFEQDIKKSRRLTYDQYLQRPLIIRFKESISRLLSPIL